MRILYETGEKPLKGDTKVGEMVHNERDGITYTKNKYGDIIVVMQPLTTNLLTAVTFDDGKGRHYIKYSDGTLIHYGHSVKVGVVAKDQLKVTAVWVDFIKTIPFIGDFSATVNCNEYSDKGGHVSKMIYPKPVPFINVRMDFHLEGTTVTAGDLIASYIAIGRWK